jgi:lipopolysaccharide transport system ATP-binding protein
LSQDVVIKVENLTKEYRFGQIGYGTVYRDLQSWWARVRGRDDPNAQIVEHRLSSGTQVSTEAQDANERFLALDDISFEVRKGEALGIIGRNGAGKSTLLKILSRVTAPSKGFVGIKGHVSSLLEVGTGFHPELTGRENVFLNGAILGMSRAEISRKFPEIVEFAEIGHFIDTPVKRYSSGMYVRLAFAVAAHLEPEILILDEVLAVGDAKFVKKCMEKMESVRHDGRTILFVSHGMSSVVDLCPRAILLENGRIMKEGPSSEVVRQYTGELSTSTSAVRVWADDQRAPGFSGSVRLLSVRSLNAAGEPCGRFRLDESIDIEFTYRVIQKRWRLSVHLYLESLGGPRLFVSMDNGAFAGTPGARAEGMYVERCRIPGRFLNAGYYSVEALICTNPTEEHHHLDVRDAVIFSVEDDDLPAGARSDWSREWPSAIVRPALNWSVERSEN